MDVMTWLLDGDPAIRWQVRRDLLDDPDGAAADRAQVETSGWGAQLLDAQTPDGDWGHGVWTPEDMRGVDDAMLQLALFGATGPRTDAAVERVKTNVDWGEEWWNHPFFDGEVEACINGRVLTAGAYFGEASELIVKRLLDEQQDDDGWNCYAETRDQPGSFHSTVDALEGLTAYRDGNGPTDVSAAIARGQEYLLTRSMMRRKRDGSLIDEGWLDFRFPYYWHYDVLRGLDYLRGAGVESDARVAEAVRLVVQKRGDDGRWTLDGAWPGAGLVAMERSGEPSRWNTLRALRVMRWAGSDL